MVEQSAECVDMPGCRNHNVYCCDDGGCQGTRSGQHRAVNSHLGHILPSLSSEDSDVTSSDDTSPVEHTRDACVRAMRVDVHRATTTATLDPTRHPSGGCGLYNGKETAVSHAKTLALLRISPQQAETSRETFKDNGMVAMMAARLPMEDRCFQHKGSHVVDRMSCQCEHNTKVMHCYPDVVSQPLVRPGDDDDRLCHKGVTRHPPSCCAATAAGHASGVNNAPWGESRSSLVEAFRCACNTCLRFLVDTCPKAESVLVRNGYVFVMGPAVLFERSARSQAPHSTATVTSSSFQDDDVQTDTISEQSPMRRSIVLPSVVSEEAIELSTTVCANGEQRFGDTTSLSIPDAAPLQQQPLGLTSVTETPLVDMTFAAHIPSFHSSEDSDQQLTTLTGPQQHDESEQNDGDNQSARCNTPVQQCRKQDASQCYHLKTEIAYPHNHVLNRRRPSGVCRDLRHVEDWAYKSGTELRSRRLTSDEASAAKVVRQQRLRVIQRAYQRMLRVIHPNADDEVATNTPLRAAKALLEMSDGYSYSAEDITLGAVFPAPAPQQMVVVRDLRFESLCEHHLLPFYGTCGIAYITHNRVLGLSKFGKVVKAIAHRLQIQEKLASEVGEALQSVLDPLGILVCISAKHCCMGIRGLKDWGSSTITSYTAGLFRTNLDLQRVALSQLS